MRPACPCLALFVGSAFMVLACDKEADVAAVTQDPAATAIASASSSPAPSSAFHRGLTDPDASARPRPAPSSSSSVPLPAARPLADWMRGPATDAWSSGDLETIATSFEQIARWAPPGYTNWKSISIDGASAARIGSLDGVKAACRECHAQYEARYKGELGARPLP